MSASEATVRHGRRAWGVGLAAGGCMLILGALLWGVNMRRGLNHDEHQFIASAVLLAREGLVPYADFPYFHLPLLSLIYAALFRVSPQLLLTARAFSVLCAWSMLGYLLITGYRRLRPRGDWLGFALGAAAAGLLTFTPLFVYTSGRAWNHDLPTLLAVIGAGLLLQGLARPADKPSPWPLALSGGLLGLAIITRASFALLIPAFLIGVVLAVAGPAHRRLRAVGWFGIGGIVGALPALVLLLLAPQNFLFGNLTYVRLNTQYYTTQLGDYPGMTLGGKLLVAMELYLRTPANGLPLLTFAGMGLWAWRRAAPGVRRQLVVLTLLVLSAFLGALVATPAQLQYFYAPLPFAVLGTLYGVAALPWPHPRAGVALVAAAALLALLLTAGSYTPGLAILTQPDAWYPRKVHARGELIGALAGEGARVLTLAPTHVLEGAASIEPAFATGAFAWRVAPQVAPEARVRLNVVGPDDLPSRLATAPRAILSGLDNDDRAEEAPLVAYAQAHGYLPVTLPDEGTLWLAPLAEWGGLVQLGGVLLPHDALRPGGAGVMTLYLQALAPMDRNLNLLTRLVGPDDTELWRADGWPFGSPTATWPVGAVWPDGRELTVPVDATPGLYKLMVSLYDPATLENVGAPATVAVMAVGEQPQPGPVQATLGESITLHDARMTREAGELTTHMTWQAHAPLPPGLVRFVQVLDGAGQVVAQQDGPVMNGFLQSQEWPLNTPIVDPVTLAVPPGNYTVITGFYDPETLLRLPAAVDDANIGDHVVLPAPSGP